MHPIHAEGIAAARAGKALSDNPYTDGFTKRGTPRVTDDGMKWLAGYASVGRIASPKEVADAAKLDVHNYGRRYRRRD